MAKERKRNIIWSGFRTAVMTAVFVLFFYSLWTTRTYAKDNTASTMRMEKTEGTVKVLGSTGKEIAVFQKMKLQSGHKVDTMEKSYAWISLDDAKLLKMDAVSEAGVRKKGKKLEVFLESGSLFFNVTEPLGDDETLNIRTSTMTIGIRGTSGWVNVIDDSNVKVSVLEGTVKVNVADPLTGQVKQDDVYAGESAICVVYDEDKAGGVERCDILKENYTEKDVKGFVLMEIATDNALCEEIYQQSGVDLRNLSQTPQQRLQEDEDNMRGMLEMIEGVFKEQENNISVAPVWEEPVQTEQDNADNLNAAADSAGTDKPKGTNQSGASGSAAKPKNSKNAGDGILDVIPNVKPEEIKKPTIPAAPTDNDDSGSQGSTGGGNTDNSGSLGGGNTGDSGNSGGTDTPKEPEPSDPPIYIGVGEGISEGISYEYNTSKKMLTIYPTTSGKNIALPDYEAGKQPWVKFAGEMKRVVLKGGITTIGDNAFLPNTETSVLRSLLNMIRTGRAASACTNLKNVTFPKSVTSIKENAFAGCPNIETVYFGGTEAEWTGKADDFSLSGISSGNKEIYFATGEAYYYYDSTKKTLTIAGDGKMGDYNIYTKRPWSNYYSQIQKIVVENDVTSIGNYAFYGCSGLAGNLEIPNSVTSIGVGAFSDCSGLTGELKIPNGITSIGSSAFSGCSGLIGELKIPDSVTSIGGSAFKGCSGLTGKLKISDGVTSIGNNVFSGCSSLTGELKIPDGVTSIGEYAFSGCSGLTGNLMIGNSVTSIDYGAFSDCSGLTGNLVIPSSVTSIGEYAFSGCSGLTGNLMIGNSVTSISYGAFNGCSGLTGNLVIPSSVKSIGEYAFSGCSGLTGNFVIPNSVKSIGDRAFFECIGLSGVTISNSVRSIGDWAFSECSRLSSVTIPDSVISIGYSAFSKCSSLSGVMIPDSVTSIESSVFSKCSSLGSVTIPNSVRSIGDWAFSECSNLSSVTIPDSVRSIGEYAFYECSSLSSVTISNSVKSVDENAFFNCSKLTDIIFKGTREEWDKMLWNTLFASKSIHCTDDTLSSTIRIQGRNT